MLSHEHGCVTVAAAPVGAEVAPVPVHQPDFGDEPVVRVQARHREVDVALEGVLKLKKERGNTYWYHSHIASANSRPAGRSFPSVSHFQHVIEEINNIITLTIPQNM